MEVACLLILGVDLEFLDSEEESQLRDEIEAISRQLTALRKAQLIA